MSNRDRAARRLITVTEEELQRIVLDIHDGPVQNLFAASSQLLFLRARASSAPDLPPDFLVTVNRALELLQLSLDSIRSVLGAFRAPEFAALPLDELIQDLVVQHETLTGATVHLDLVKPLPALSLPAKIAAYRILQESLSNIQRHAGVDEATVRAWATRKRAHLEIIDCGRGFEPPPLTGQHATERHEHIGLRGMRERAQLVGGQLRVVSTPGQGTVVHVELPCDD